MELRERSAVGELLYMGNMVKLNTQINTDYIIRMFAVVIHPYIRQQAGLQSGPRQFWAVVAS